MTVLSARGVLFDMDGTLVDSTAVVETLWTEFAHKNGAPSADVIEFAHGRPSRDTVARFAAEPARADEWLEWIYTAEAEHFDEVTAIPGAVDVARALPSGSWAVVTSALAGPAAQRLALVGLPVPQVLIGADDVVNGKPDPEGYARAARELRLEPSDCIVFEDTEAGLLAGHAAGCQIVAVGNLARIADGVPRIPDFTGVSVASVGDRLEIRLP